jgi:tetratricopeptide (TPR) repeat protein
MIQRKVDLIDEEDLRLLETASLQGYEFDSAVTTRVLEMEPLKVEERLERLERLHRFVRLIGEQDMPNRTLSCRYQFVHSLYQNAFVADLRPVRRKILTSATARVLEEFYGDRRGEIAGLLASLHDACGESGQAIEYYLLAAQNAATLFAHREAAAMARRGLEMLREWPPSPERDTQELVLQLSLGRSAAIRGYTDPEASACFTRAKELAPILGHEAQFFPAIWGLWVCRFVRAETTETADLSEQLQAMAENSSNPILLAGAHYAMALQYVITGNLCRVQHHLEQIISVGEHEKNQARVSRLVLDPVVSAQGLFMLVSWAMGHPDQAQAKMKDTLARIETEKWDPRSVCDVLIFASVIQKFCGNISDVEHLSSRVIAICDKYDFSVERQWALFNRGWSLAATGSIGEGIAEMEASLDNLFSKGVMMFGGTLYASELAETYLRVGFPDRAHLRIKEALSFVKRTGHSVFESELHRIEGSLLARGATDTAKVEECFEQAIEVARKQQARSLELRAATSLARFRASLGKIEAARGALAPVYSGFTEGFDTLDLRQARTLLEKLR